MSRYAPPSRPSGRRALVAQRIEHLTTDQEVAGSNPAERTALHSSEGPSQVGWLPSVDRPATAIATVMIKLFWQVPREAPGVVTGGAASRRRTPVQPRSSVTRAPAAATAVGGAACRLLRFEHRLGGNCELERVEREVVLTGSHRGLAEGASAAGRKYRRLWIRVQSASPTAVRQRVGEVRVSRRPAVHLRPSAVWNLPSLDGAVRTRLGTAFCPADYGLPDRAS